MPRGWWNFKIVRKPIWTNLTWEFTCWQPVVSCRFSYKKFEKNSIYLYVSWSFDLTPTTLTKLCKSNLRITKHHRILITFIFSFYSQIPLVRRTSKDIQQEKHYVVGKILNYFVRVEVVIHLLSWSGIKMVRKCEWLTGMKRILFLQYKNSFYR